jgi:hypothetical protein
MAMGSTDSRHWSQRWLRCAQVGADAVVLYDLHQPVEIRGCGRGKCVDLEREASTKGARYRVMRFWQMDMCPSCGRPFDYSKGQESLYHGDSIAEAAGVFALAEASLFGELSADLE